MEVKPGYKQTEIGVIPCDWETKRLGDLAHVYQPVTIAASKFTEDGFPVYGANGQVGYYHSANHHSWQTTITCRGSTCGTVNRTADRCWITGNAMVINCDQTKGLDKEFFYNLLSSQDFSDCITGTGQPQIVRSPITNFQVALPSAAIEQTAIATALGAVDALLAAQDALIAKKRAIKQGAMQELLTGKRRLPGFKEGWEVKSLDILSTRAAGVWGGDKPDVRRCQLAQVIRAGDIAANGQLSATAARYVSDAEFASAKCELDDLVITTSGNGLGKLWLCDGRENVAASNFVRVIRPKKGRAVGPFLYYALKADEGVRQLTEHTATSAYPNLRQTYFKESWIPTPTVPEQVAIATVLSDMDGEIQVLEREQEKTVKLKRGMMQELLTGRIRLV